MRDLIEVIDNFVATRERKRGDIQRGTSSPKRQIQRNRDFREFIGNLMSSRSYSMDDQKVRRTKQSTEAVKKLSRAAQERQMASHLEKRSPAEALFHRGYAQELEKEASSLLRADHPVQRGPGHEAVPSAKNHDTRGICDNRLNSDIDQDESLLGWRR